jgi:hypothetical protein
MSWSGRWQLTIDLGHGFESHKKTDGDGLIKNRVEPTKDNEGI